MQEKDGKYIFGVVKLGDKGQIVIPKDARKLYGLNSGDALLVLLGLMRANVWVVAVSMTLGKLLRYAVLAAGALGICQLF